MSGEDLYRLWCSKLARQNSYRGPSHPEWAFLSYHERNAWEDAARAFARILKDADA